MRRRWWPLLVLAAVVAAAYVGGSRGTAGAPLDPDSTAPDGTRAMVELVERLGGEVEEAAGLPDPSVRVALLLEDRLGRDDADALGRWVRTGGTLVVADPLSSLTPPASGRIADRVSDPGCRIGGLGDVSAIEIEQARTYRLDGGEEGAGVGCFADGDGGWFVVETTVGDGRIVSLGGTDPFVNRHLDRADDAVLVAGLLVDRDAPTALLRPTPVGSGDRTLTDLVGTPVWAALAQLVVAFVVVVAWRARRLGRPVAEPQPVQIQGSELTGAVGRLMQRGRRPDRAAAILRDRARRDLSGRLGLPLDASVDAVRSALGTRTTLTPQEIDRAVVSPVTDDADLVDVSRLLTRIREEIDDVPAPTHV